MADRQWSYPGGGVTGVNRLSAVLISITAVGLLGQSPPPEPTPCPPSAGVFRGGPLPTPDKLMHVDPVFPERAAPTKVGEQLWIGEAEIGEQGKVLSVKVLRRVSLEPAWPEWEDAIPAALRQWRFSPSCLLGKPQRVFLTITFDPKTLKFRPMRRRE